MNCKIQKHLEELGTFARIVGSILTATAAYEFWDYTVNWNLVCGCIITAPLLMYRKKHYLQTLYFWIIALILTFICVGILNRMGDVVQIFIGYPMFIVTLWIYKTFVVDWDNIFY